MKKFLFIFMALILVTPVFSQTRRVAIPASLREIAVPDKGPVNDYTGPVQNSNPYVSTRAIREADLIGNTFYDIQSNGSMSQRIFLTEDGKEAAVWMRGITATNYPDRGTGYNFYDGAAWGPVPSSRIEPVRTGWPSIARWNGNGEVVIAHQSVGPMQLSKRDVMGTGNWTTIEVSSPAGAPDPIWPAMITSGPNNQYIHIIAVSTPSDYGGFVYEGLDGAILYFRSADGGETWEKQGVILPGMESPEYYGFGPDSYSWAKPHGDTIAFAYGDSWTDEFIMYSYDNGDTWNKTIVLSNQYKAQAPGTVVDPFYCTDGSSALAIDRNGVFHLTFGRMRVADQGAQRVWFPYTDGLIYWNSTMPPVQDSLIWDTLVARGQMIGYVYENVVGDSVISIPYYNVGMSSYSNITIDENDGRMYVIYSGVVVDNPSNEMNFRHIIARGSNDYMWNYYPNIPEWGDFYDANTSIDDIYIEFLFPSMAKETTSSEIHYVVQSSDVQGSNILDPNIVVHDNSISHNEILKNDIILVNGINEADKNTITAIRNFPNPFTGMTTVYIQINHSANAVLEVTSLTGQIVMTMDLGTLHTGINQVNLYAGSLRAGVYIYSVKANGVVYSNRMIVK